MCGGSKPSSPKPVKMPDPTPPPPPPEPTAEAPVVEGPGRSQRKSKTEPAAKGKRDLRIDLSIPAPSGKTSLNIPQG